MDGEAPGNNPIRVSVNGQSIHEGKSWFESWDGLGNGDKAAWTTVEIVFPPELLIAGQDRLTIRNLSDAANLSAPPYVLVSACTITGPESESFGEPGDIELESTVFVSG